MTSRPVQPQGTGCCTRERALVSSERSAIIPRMSSRQRVVVANPADGGFFYWLLKFYLFGAFVLFAAAVASLPAVYLAVAADTPRARDLGQYADEAPLPSSIHAFDGRRLATLSKQHRELVDLSAVPPLLIKAFLAAEDRDYFEHGGVDFRGILRAAWANLQAGAVRQGGSTITQQVAKSQLSPERTIQRKLRELVLARRLEARYSKRQILGFYLNQIYLGSNAYGVQAAATEYFDKKLGQLTLSEMALIAGLVRAPSRYSPRNNIERARRRRDVVLKAMLDAGFIDKARYDASRRLPIELAEHDDPDPMRWLAPHFTEQIRRTLVEHRGKDALYTAGWRISTTIDLAQQAWARRRSLAAAEALDKRQGWRGPISRTRSPSRRKRIRGRMKALYQLDQLVPHRAYVALVDRVTPSRVLAHIGDREIVIPLSLMAWAAPYSRVDYENEKTITSAREALHAGDLIWVRAPKRWQRRKGWGGPKDKRPIMALDQRPRVEAAMLAYDHQSGYVQVMVGGLDYDRSTFNRVTQACRQPGSAYKPIYYSLALDGKYSMGSIWQDKPYVPEPGEEWNPQNVHGTLDGRVTMHFSLVKSLNLPSIHIINAVGHERTKRWARRLGFTTPIHADKALALGASCVHMDELTRAFATFVRGGTQRDPIYIRQIHDRDGTVIEDHTTATDPLLAEGDRLDRMWATLRPAPRQIIDPRTAFLITKLLRDSVTYGIAARCRIVPVPTGGKGGTSSDTMDVWFVGFTSQWAVATWLGDDSYKRPLGKKEASYTSAIPMWANFMKRAVDGRPHRELPLHRPKGLRTATIDFLTGGPPQPGHRSVRIYFKPGTWQPQKAGAPQPKQAGAPAH